MSFQDAYDHASASRSETGSPTRYSPLAKQDLRVCIDVVKTIARERGIAKDPAAIADLMTAVAHKFNIGIRSYDELVADIRSDASMRGASGK